jgi:hypothetical protein
MAAQAAARIDPEVANSLLGDQGILSLMGQPKMMEAIRTLKEDPRAYQQLISQDAELAAMMAALQGAMASAEEEHVKPPQETSDALAARDTALASAQKSNWQRAVDECERGLRTATGELAHELKALRDRYKDRLAAERKARADEAARKVTSVRKELSDAIAAASDLGRLQAAVDAARAHGLKAEPIVAQAQRLLVKLLEAKSGERMRQMREQANQAAARAASSSAPQCAPPAPAAPTPGPRISQALDNSVSDSTSSKVTQGSISEPEPELKPAAAQPRAAAAADASAIREAVLDNPLLFELD